MLDLYIQDKKLAKRGSHRSVKDLCKHHGDVAVNRLMLTHSIHYNFDDEGVYFKARKLPAATKCPPSDTPGLKKAQKTRAGQDHTELKNAGPTKKEHMAVINASRKAHGLTRLKSSELNGPLILDIRKRLAATPEGENPWKDKPKAKKAPKPAKPKKRRTSTPTAPGVTGDEDYIVLKHLCREFDCDGFKLRQLLRREFTTPAGKRWKWDQNNAEDAKQLEAIRTYLAERLTPSSKTT